MSAVRPVARGCSQFREIAKWLGRGLSRLSREREGVHRITDTIVSEAASAVSAREKRGYPDIEGLLLSEA